MCDKELADIALRLSAELGIQLYPLRIQGSPHITLSPEQKAFVKKVLDFGYATGICSRAYNMTLYDNNYEEIQRLLE